MKLSTIVSIAIGHLCISPVWSVNHLTDAQSSLVTHARSGHFIAAPEFSALVQWADQEAIYSYYGFEDIEHYASKERQELVSEIGALMHSPSKAEQFMQDLATSGLPEAIQNKILSLAYINLSNS